MSKRFVTICVGWITLWLLAWGASQFKQVVGRHVYDYGDGPGRTGTVPRASISYGSSRGGLRMLWTPRQGDAYTSGPNTLGVFGAAPITELDRPLVWPGWRHDPPDVLEDYWVLIPYWLICLPPSIALAWAWWRRRLERRRGFEVQPAG